MFSTWLRGIGGVAQIVGVLLVVVEIYLVRKGFPSGRQGRLGRIVDRLLHRKPQPKHATAAPGSIPIGVRLSVGVEKWIDTWDAEQKINELRERIARLQKAAAELGQSIRREGDERRIETQQRLDELRGQIEATDRRINSLATGSLQVRGYGVLFLVPGIVLATWSTEIAGWFGAS